MTREEVINELRRHESDLRQMGVVRLSLFGSVARGDAGAASDVDLLAQLDGQRRLSLLDVVGIEQRISAWLGRQVDLVEEGRLQPRVQASAETDLVRAF